MQIKTILAVFAMASLATAAPEPEALEKRDCLSGQTRFCCTTYFPFDFFIISHLGSGCVKSMLNYIPNLPVKHY
jgi:hypothetical protein